MTKTDFLKFREKYFNSQADMSRQSEISTSTLSNLENGNNPPSAPMKWAMRLFIRIVYLEKILKKNKIKY